MKTYPKLLKSDIDSVASVLQFIIRERQNDVTENTNLPQIFIGGRKVGKIPTSSIDIVATDKVGDLNYDPNYLYIVVDNAGTAEWRRGALAAW